MTRFADSRWLPGALVIGATLVIFGWSIRFPLLAWDDHLNISENRLINPPSLGGLLVLWTRPYAGLYVPATYTWWSGEAALAGLPATVDQPYPLDARVFHTGNVLLHAANAWLVWLLLVRLTGSRWGAAAGALLFALHPMQVESACWVTETKGLLCGMFSFSALLVFDRFVARCGEGRSRPGELSGKSSFVLLYLAAATLFALALLAKPAAATLPLAAWLLVTWPGRTRRVAVCVPLLDGGDRAELGAREAAGKQCDNDSALLAGGPTDHAARSSIVAPASSGTRVTSVSNLSRSTVAMFLSPWLAMALGFAILTREAQAAETLVEPTAWWQRPVVAADALAFYLYKLALPLRLAPDYGRSPAWLLASDWVWVTWLLPVGLAGVVAWPRLRWWRLAGLLSIVLLLPVLGLIPFAFQRFSTVADRYAYLAMAGPAIVLAAVASGARRGTAAAVAVLALCALVSAAQTRHWHSDRALFAHAVAVNLQSSVALNGLGNIHSRNRDWSAAAAYYRRAVEADPHNASSYFNVGRAELALGRPLPAIESFERALELRPGYLKVREPYAQALVAMNRIDDGAVQLQLLIEAQPDNPTAWENLGRVRAFQGRTAEAIQYLKRALEINPRQDSAQRELARLSGQERTSP